MTLAPDRPTASSGAAVAPGASESPLLADGVDLIGEMEGSGYKEPPSLVRRSDGQVIQLPPLLYAVAAKADGQRTYEQIATELTQEIQRGVDADSVRFLADEKLRPLGILCAADGTSPQLQKADPFLGFKWRAAVIPERVANRVGALFRPLFYPVVVLAVVAGFIAADVWLFGVHGVAQSMREAMYSPVFFLPLFAAIVLSAGFHEVGHAAGCRYGGGRPGKMGCGLYLAWPAFYTDVTDAYRLGRRGRLRTDLGGVYFNILIVLATVGAYALTSFEPLLILALVQHFEIVHQLLPIVRLDGYYIVADATGVPDLFARIGPILRSMVPWKKADERVIVLKRWVRVAVTAWVLVVVPLLLFQMFVLLVHLPRILGTAWDSGTKSFEAMQEAFGSGNVFGGISSALQLVVLALPMIGILLVLAGTLKRSSLWVWRRSEGRPAVRALTLVASTIAAGLLLFSWLSPENYEPIRPGERGTLIEGVRAVRDLPNLPAASPPDPSSAPGTATEATTTTAGPTTTVPTSTTAAPVTTVAREGPAGAAVTTTTIATTTTQAPATTTTGVPRTTTTVAE